MLVVYLDGIVFGDYHVLAAVGVDTDGRKHVLGLCGGASENTEVTAGLLEDLVARGLRADRRRLFVIDGAKALRAAVGRVFGSSSLREGLSALFTVNRLGLPKPLRRCLTTTNIIDSSHAGVRQHTNRVSRWQNEAMAMRLAAVTFRETEKHYRRITGYEHLYGC